MAIASVGLKTHIWNNQIRTVILLACFPLLITGLVFLFFYIQIYLEVDMNQQQVSNLVLIRYAFKSALAIFHWVLLVTVIWFTIAWFKHSAMIKSMTFARSLHREEDPELYDLLETLCISRGIPMPKLNIIDSNGLNAFASGMSNKNYAITVTKGLRNRLNKRELRGVLAHELTHILNNDTRFMMVAIIFVGIFSISIEILFRSMRFRNITVGRGRSNNGVAMLIALALMVVGYFFSMLVRFAISRKREYLADAGAVELTKDPRGLINALIKISGRAKVEGLSDKVASLCIANPDIFGLFATHPKMEKRIAVLKQFL